jgi:TP901-1 family phage major tail protein
MAAQKGLEMLLKADTDGAGTYVTLGGIQATSLSLDQEDVDITSQDDTSRYRQLLSGAGIKSVDFTGEGVFKDDTGIGTAWTYWQNNTFRNWRVIIPSFKQVQGPFRVKLKFSADENKEVKFSIDAASAGDLTITDI